MNIFYVLKVETVHDDENHTSVDTWTKLTKESIAEKVIGILDILVDESETPYEPTLKKVKGVLSEQFCILHDDLIEKEYNRLRNGWNVYVMFQKRIDELERGLENGYLTKTEFSLDIDKDTTMTVDGYYVLD